MKKITQKTTLALSQEAVDWIDKILKQRAPNLSPWMLRFSVIQKLAGFRFGFNSATDAFETTIRIYHHDSKVAQKLFRFI